MSLDKRANGIVFVGDIGTSIEQKIVSGDTVTLHHKNEEVIVKVKSCSGNSFSGIVERSASAIEYPENTEIEFNYEQIFGVAKK